MNNFRCQSPHAIHFSGGRTSGFMLHKHLEAHDGKLPEGVQVIFCNTGKERTETLDFVERCSLEWAVPVIWLEYRYIPGEPGSPGIAVAEPVKVPVWDEDDEGETVQIGEVPGIKTTIHGRKAPKGKHTFEIVNYATASRQGEPFEQIIQARGFLPNVVARFCTVEMKIRTAQRYLKSLGWDHLTSSIGLRADEPARVSRLRGTNRHSNEEPDAPLARSGFVLDDVRRFWESQPFDLALESYQGNCDLCFLKGRGKIQKIMRENPELAEWWIDQEKTIKSSKSARNASFRADRPRYEHLLKQVQEQPLLPFSDEEPTIDCFCGEE